MYIAEERYFKKYKDVINIALQGGGRALRNNYTDHNWNYDKGIHTIDIGGDWRTIMTEDREHHIYYGFCFDSNHSKDKRNTVKCNKVASLNKDNTKVVGVSC